MKLTDFLNKHGVKYKIKGDRVIATLVILNRQLIRRLPDDIGKLDCIELSLRDNLLTELPESFGNVNSSEIYLSGNSLKSLPESIKELKCHKLSLRDNPLDPCLHLFKNFDDNCSIYLPGTSMYKTGKNKVSDYRKEIDLAYELRKPDNAGIKSMFDMGLF